jgi:PilZ domain
MKSNTENRNKTRFTHESNITLENTDIELRCKGRMYNFSEAGIYIESDSKLEPEVEILVGISDSPFASEPGTHEQLRGTVKWRKELTQASFYYGYGIELIENDGQILKLDRLDGTRVNPRKEITIPVTIESDDETFDGVAENVDRDGAFVKSNMLMSTGKFIRMEIPLKKKGKIARLVGKITRTNLRGFGVKFLKLK